MQLAKVGDLVELLDRAPTSDPDGGYEHWPSGIIGIVTDKEDLTQMPIVTWLNIEEVRYTWPQKMLKIISEAPIE